MRINKKEYDNYISSEQWLKKREEVFAEKWRMCEKCLSMHNLCIHHWTYVRLGNELIKDLFVLCNKCHFELHELCWTRDLLRNTKRFIAGLPYEERSNTQVQKSNRSEYLKERKRVRREKSKRKVERRAERIRNWEVIIKKPNVDYSDLQKHYAVFKPIHNTHWFDFREFYIVNWKIKKLKIIPIPEWDLSIYPVFKPAKMLKSGFQEQFKDYLIKYK